MLFNKNNNGIEELQKYITSLYSSTKWGEIKTDVELAEEEIKKVIGNEVFNTAQAHYDSPAYNPDGNTVLDNLVFQIQMPTSFLAFFEFTKANDVSHESTGRKIKIDVNNEKIPFEWMLDRDDATILRKANKTFDRLIVFLDENEVETNWKDSDAQKLARSLFVNTAKQFDEYYPIDESRRFFLKVTPFIKKLERKNLMPILKDKYEPLKAAIVANNLTADDEVLLTYILDFIVMETMALALQRFAVQVIPEGVFQNEYQLSTKSKKVAIKDVKDELMASLKADADKRFDDLNEYLKKLNTPTYTDEDISVLPINDIDNKYFRT